MSTKIELKLEISRTLIDEILFNRPVGPLHKKNICLLAGRYTSLHSIDTVYSVINALGHYPIIIADEALSSQLVPAELFLRKSDRDIAYTNSDMAIELINNCHIVLAGLGLGINPALQILLEKLFNSCNLPIVIFESLFRLPNIKQYLDTNKLLLGSLVAYQKLNQFKLERIQSGLNQKINLLKDISAVYQTNVLCCDKNQYLAVNPKQRDIAIINDQLDFNPFIAIMTSLLADRDKPLSAGWLDYFLVTGFLYKNYYQGFKRPLEKLKSLLY